MIKKHSKYFGKRKSRSTFACEIRIRESGVSPELSRSCKFHHTPNDAFEPLT